MRLLRNSRTSQKAIAHRENVSLRNFVTSKLKPLNKTYSKLSVEDTDTDTPIHKTYGLISPGKKDSILQLSKKIQKFNLTSKAPLKPLTNLSSKSSSIVSKATTTNDKFFLEDTYKVTKNYVTLSYSNFSKTTNMDFLCFHERDLDISSTFSDKIVSHSCDNDVDSDDEQINSAIKTLYSSLEEAIKEEKKGKNSSHKRSKK